MVYGGGCERVAKLERPTRSGSGSGSSQVCQAAQGGASSQVARCRPKSSSTQTRPYARRPAPSTQRSSLPGSGSRPVRPVNTPQCPLSWPNILAPAPGPSLLSSSDSLLLHSIHFCSLSSLRLSQKSTTVSGQKYLSLSPRFVHPSSLIVSQHAPAEIIDHNSLAVENPFHASSLRSYTNNPPSPSPIRRTVSSIHFIPQPRSRTLPPTRTSISDTSNALPGPLRLPSRNPSFSTSLPFPPKYPSISPVDRPSNPNHSFQQLTVCVRSSP